MVERLKAAIEKAREQRGGALAQGAPAAAGPAQGAPAGNWGRLAEIAPDPAALRRGRVVSWDRADPAYLSFDVLRTRLLSACRERGWTRIAITSPTQGCGKTTVAANLAFSLARQPETRTALIDLDLRAPRLAALLGLREKIDIAAYLEGRTPHETALRRLGDNLALGLNTERVRNSAEMLQNTRTADILRDMTRWLSPDLTLCDLPPLLVSDDAIAALTHVDATLLVVAADETTPRQIEDCERLLGENANFLGVVLNKCRAEATATQYYDYAAG